MSETNSSSVQKEILEPVKRYFERQREEDAQRRETKEAAKEISETKDRKLEGRYEPSSDFYKIFSNLIGNKPEESKEAVTQRAQDTEEKVEIDKIENVEKHAEPAVSKESPQEADNIELVQKVDKGKRSKSSVFERLAHKTDTEAQNSKPDVESSEIETGKASESSIFEMLGHRSIGNKPKSK